MPRQPELERILQAWWEVEGCHASEKNVHRAVFNRLLDEARAGTHLSRQDFTEMHPGLASFLGSYVSGIKPMLEPACPLS